MSHPSPVYVVYDFNELAQIGGEFGALGQATEFAAKVRAGDVPAYHSYRGRKLEVHKREYVSRTYPLFTIEVDA